MVTQLLHIICLSLIISTGIRRKLKSTAQAYGQKWSNLHGFTFNSDLRDSSVRVARGKAYIGIREGNKEKGKTKISCENCCPRLGRLPACLAAQWKKSALFARDSSPRAPRRHIAPLYKLAETGCSAIVIECEVAAEQMGTIEVAVGTLMYCLEQALWLVSLWHIPFSSSSSLCNLSSFVVKWL